MIKLVTILDLSCQDIIPIYFSAFHLSMITDTCNGTGHKRQPSAVQSAQVHGVRLGEHGARNRRHHRHRHRSGRGQETLLHHPLLHRPDQQI